MNSTIQIDVNFSVIHKLPIPVPCVRKLLYEANVPQDPYKRTDLQNNDRNSSFRQSCLSNPIVNRKMMLIQNNFTIDFHKHVLCFQNSISILVYYVVAQDIQMCKNNLTHLVAITVVMLRNAMITIQVISTFYTLKLCGTATQLQPEVNHF